jgi:phospholipid transport system substrate-binding protein
MLTTKRTGFFRIPAFVALVAVASIGLSIATVKPASATADDPVRKLNDALLNVMQNAESLGYQGRVELLTPVLEDVFSFDRMAAFSVGREWEAFDGPAKQALIDVFTRLSIAEFASRFNDFAGEQFEIGSIVEGRRGLVLVENSIVKSDGEAIDINYVVGRPDGDWRIIDIRLGGAVSELSTKRSEYGSVLRSTTPLGLIQLLEEKIEDIESDS